jgi:uncharacterized ferritin-like protein (DUF455 family)
MDSASLRMQAMAALQLASPADKAAATAAITKNSGVWDVEMHYDEPVGLPCRPVRPVLVSALEVRSRPVKSIEGRAAMVHALAHIELNAIDLALDIIWRFAKLPEQFYYDWLQVAQEEAIHFGLLEQHLQTMGFTYGDFPAHNGLWDMAQKTRHDPLTRLALVPRTLEARGLDASPLVREKLRSVGDLAGAQILDIILRDEIGHVAIGNHWYKWLCQQRNLDPITTYANLAAEYGAPRPKGPINWSARRQAGFDEKELAALQVNHHA